MANDRKNIRFVSVEEPTEKDIFHTLITLIDERRLPSMNLYYFRWRLEEIENKYRKSYRELPRPLHFSFLQNLNRVPTDADLVAMTESCECDMCVMFMTCGRWPHRWYDGRQFRFHRSCPTRTTMQFRGALLYSFGYTNLYGLKYWRLSNGLTRYYNSISCTVSHATSTDTFLLSYASDAAAVTAAHAARYFPMWLFRLPLYQTSTHSDYRCRPARAATTATTSTMNRRWLPLIARASIVGSEEYIYFNFLEVLDRADDYGDFQAQLHYVADEFRETFPNQRLPTHFRFFFTLSTLPTNAQMLFGISSCSCRICTMIFYTVILGHIHTL